MKVVLRLSFLCLAFFSVSVFAAEKVTITGEPVVLEQRGETYYLPSGYTATTAPFYVTLNGTQRVCYPEKQPGLATLDVMMVKVEMGGSMVDWNCYQYSTEYFVIQ